MEQLRQQIKEDSLLQNKTNLIIRIERFLNVWHN